MTPSRPPRPEPSLFCLPMGAVLLAQFLSAFADNALLIAAIAELKRSARLEWIPLLQACFVVPFILFAPYVGALADAFPKGRVMLLANAIKLAGAALLALGLNPLASYAVAGMGAAAYSPAKYGILSQLFGPAKLVKANGMLEGSTIVAILSGVMVGGWLADQSPAHAMAGVIAAYGLAAAFNLLIPRLPPEHPLSRFDAAGMLREFLASAAILWRDRDARFSLLGTSLFWGTGTTLRLLLFAWVPVALAIGDNQTPANLMGLVSLGIVLGAGLAATWVGLESVNRVLAGGLALGPMILALSFQSSLAPSLLLLVGLGMAGGLFIVPLNALLQARGHASVGAGHALAVQNLWENAAMFLFVGAYYLAEAAQTPVRLQVAGFGVAVLIGAGILARWRQRGPGPG
ncbi:MAG TPA: lysophospholipid transporter LplT [Thiobacillaceae bacterium]|nr:lysophospholipid transporter LplT [Thiobacillaceae bacterium]HNI06860.1 lysophospholipid transporter LplT [Thiobacillaceae bacterium]